MDRAECEKIAAFGSSYRITRTHVGAAAGCDLLLLKLETQLWPDRRGAALLRFQNRPAQRTQALILKHPAINARPARLRRQQAAAQGAIS
ncbi:hypothetical protein D3C87_1787830 [compost metagenome]